MRVRLRRDGVERVVEFDFGLDGLGVADLAAALGAEISATGERFESEGLYIDRSWYDPRTRLSSVQIYEGALLEPASASKVELVPSTPNRAQHRIDSYRPGAVSRPATGLSGSQRAATFNREAAPKRISRSARPKPHLVVTGGLDAGVVLTQAAGRRRRWRWMIGRSHSCDLTLDDPAVSRRHALLEADGTAGSLRVTDLGSRNATSIKERAITGATQLSRGVTLRLGTTCLQWRQVINDTPPSVRAGIGAAGGKIPFNRPPRRCPQMTQAGLSLPAEPPERPEQEPLSWAGIVLPVVAGLILAVLWSPFMAVFAILGPLVTISTCLERRRRSRNKHETACEEVTAAVRELAATLPAAKERERQRLIALVPDLGEIVRRASCGSVRCWERRLGDPDGMRLGVGTADLAFSPPFTVEGGAQAAPEALAVLHEAGNLGQVPVAVSLSSGEVVGIIGAPPVARAVARSLLLQAAVLHGPADLAVVAMAPGHAREWSWLRWLPHTTDLVAGTPGALVATEAKQLVGVADTAIAEPSKRIKLTIIDGSAALAGRKAAGRLLSEDETVAAIVIAKEASDLPCTCTTIVEARRRSAGLRLVDPRSAVVLKPVIPWGVSIGTASEAAARLARLDDPDLRADSANLSALVPLVDLIGDLTADAVMRRWAETRGTADLKAPIGAASDGPLELDLVADGPHMLVGGTTGSGKSELLRSLVAALAVSADPEHLAFVLVDYKGGAAFDRCADMPHVAGLVTDLDDRLAERALICLEAELRRREARLREVGAEDLVAFRAATRGKRRGSTATADSGSMHEPLPRLVVVVDEFATLAAELPDFMQSLVGIAQRGRSLGVHMVLATQRPAGVVTEDIRANTSCRIALRVTDRHDSNDVIGSPEAARIARRRPGRAFARFGPSELVAFQSALVTGTTSDSTGLRVRILPEFSDPSADPSSGVSQSFAVRCLPPTHDTQMLDASPHIRAREINAGQQVSGAEQAATETSEPTDLDRVVEAVRAAHQRCGGIAPRSPWPAPLPEAVSLEQLTTMAGPRDRAAWLVDDPHNQSQFSDGWRPEDGHLVVLGGPKSGTSTTLATCILDICTARSATELHVYVIDLDSGQLEALADLPNVGASVGPADNDRRLRVLRFLDGEVARRRASADGGRGKGASARIVLVVDDFAGLARAHDPVRDTEPHERFNRIWSDGPAVGVHVAVSIGRSADLPADLSAAAGVVLVHATADSSEGLRFGLRSGTSDLAVGRAIRADDGRELLVGLPCDGDLPAAVASLARGCIDTNQGPTPIGSLPAVVDASLLPLSAEVVEHYVDLRFAMSDLNLESVGLRLHDGEHALVLGPPRTGRSTTLAAIGAAARDSGLQVVVVSPKQNPLWEELAIARRDPGELSEHVTVGDWPPHSLVLVDDAEHVEDVRGGLADLASSSDCGVHLIVVTTPERMRSCYGHWLASLRSCRSGVLFRPGPLDGDLLGVSLPPRLRLTQLPGRGVIVAEGESLVAQVAMPYLQR